MWLGAESIKPRQPDILVKGMLEWKVCDLLKEGEGWDWGSLQQLNMSKLVELASVTVKSDQHRSDEARWLSGSTPFSAKSAYAVASKWDEENLWDGWKSIWRLRVRQRVKVFVWLMAHEKLLTNGERLRRKMALSSLWVRCGLREEDNVHAIRDCDQARGLWERLISPQIRMEFFSSDMHGWITWMLRRGQRLRDEGCWVGRMMTLAWLQWRWRNEEILGAGRPSIEWRLQHVVHCFEDDDAAYKFKGLQPEASCKAHEL